MRHFIAVATTHALANVARAENALVAQVVLSAQAMVTLGSLWT